MNIYVVTFSLANPNEMYSRLLGILGEYGATHSFHPGACLLASEKAAIEIRDAIKVRLGDEDSIFIAQMAERNWAGFRTRLQAWIASHRNSGDGEL